MKNKMEDMEMKENDDVMFIIYHKDWKDQGEGRKRTGEEKKSRIQWKKL